jgi:hypothetical protein
MFGQEFFTEMKCPNCESTMSVRRQSATNPVSPAGCLVIAAPLLGIFHHATCPSIYECQNCNQVFERQNRGAQIALLAAFVLIISFFVYAVASGQIGLSDRQPSEQNQGAEQAAP